MTQEELIALVQKGESQNLEFKKTTGQRQQAVKTICAFLNGPGGNVLFGVNDKGEIPGQLVSSRTLEELAREFKLLDPSVSLGIDIIPLKNGHSVVVVKAKTRDGAGPYTFDGRPYERVGSTTTVMAKPVYENLLLEKLQPAQRWESMPAPENITVDD
ncbi:ATP-binding protein, partial [bacterium]|nr:ATP-binding protein [bacterium]